MTREQSAGFRIQTHVGNSIHCSTYSQQKISEAIDTIIGTKYLSDRGIERIKVEPIFKVEKKKYRSLLDVKKEHRGFHFRKNSF